MGCAFAIAGSVPSVLGEGRSIMPRATYAIEFELTHNTYTDLTADLHVPTPISIARGILPGQRMAEIGEMTCALYSRDGRYLPGHSNQMAGFEVGIGVRLLADAGAGQQTLFYGRLYDVVPSSAPGNHGHVVYLTVHDDLARYAETGLQSYPLAFNQRSDEVIRELLTRVPLPPGQAGFWLLGLPESRSKLGETTTLGDRITGTDIDTGRATFPWVGDRWRAEQSVRRALQDVVQSEPGHFYIGADGRPTFDQRQVRPSQVTAAATLTAKLVSVRAERRRVNLINQVEMTVYPRVASTEREVLWQLNNDVVLERGEARTFTVSYRDPLQAAVLLGAVDVLAPVPDVDARFVGYRYQMIGGLRLLHPYEAKQYIDVQTEIGAASATITVTNRDVPIGQLHIEKLQIRGKPLRVYEPLTVVLSNQASQLENGRLTDVLDLPLADDSAQVVDLGYSILNNNSQPRPWLTLEFEATADTGLLNQALLCDVNDRVHITDATLGLQEAGAYIDFIRHMITAAGASHEVTWQTSPADREAYWLLAEVGYGALGQTTRLGY